MNFKFFVFATMLLYSVDASPIVQELICPDIACKLCAPWEVPVEFDARGCWSSCKCKAIKNPCERIKCPTGKQCEVDFLSGRPSCVCPSICIALYAPICGSDGKTYGNSCQLGVHNCRFNKKVTIVSDGPCGSAGKKNM